MTNPIGLLTAADEGFCHQIADTFAVVGSTDLAWTEKVCAMAAARDGSLQLGFGLGKYANRNVMDGYGGISRGALQITVRGSRRLAPEPERTVIGPLRYEVIEPLRKIRFALDPNPCQPIAFDWLFEGQLPPRMEDRTHLRAGYRVSSELVRFHQIGVCSGWVEIDGVRTALTPETWVSTRDHSWGVRYDVGQPIADLEPSDFSGGGSYHFLWSPILMQRADGSRHGIFFNYGLITAPGFSQRTIMGGIEHPDGRFEKFADLVPHFAYHPKNRRLQGGRLDAVLEGGSRRRYEVEVVSDTGFHLGTGLYFGWNGHHHGEWRGALHVEGERIEDCRTPENARRLHQIRDTVVRVRDLDSRDVGFGNAQPIITGGVPELGLAAEDSFL